MPTDIRKRGDAWMRIRAQILRRDGHRCVVCGSEDGLQIDHIIELRQGGDNSPGNLQTLCAAHHKQKTAMHTRAAAKKSKRSMDRPETPLPAYVRFFPRTSAPLERPSEPFAMASSLPVVTPSHQLTGLEDAGTPRFWPEPHPDAVGSLGGELADYAADVIGQPLLDWQRAVADELLTIDAHGRWVHRVALLIVPRQSGKSYLLRALCEWRASLGDVVLATSAKLQAVKHLMQPTQLRVRNDPAFLVLRSKEQPEVCWPGWTEESGRWIGQAANSMLGRGFTASTAIIDEVQDVDPDALEAVSPTMTEMDNPLLVMTGTAPRGDSPLLLGQRDIALQHGPIALMEWSAPPGADWRDEETWRAASPRWTQNRLRYLRGETVKPEHFFRSEYLCQAQRGGAEPWLDFATWDRSRHPLEVPNQVQIAAIEDARGGLGGSISLAWAEGRDVCVTGWTTPSLAEAWREAARAERVLCGITLRNEPEAKALNAKPYGRRETATALPELRRLLAAGLRWDGDDLDREMRSAVIREDSTGSLTVAAGRPSGVMRTTAWAVQGVRLHSEPVLV